MPRRFAWVCAGGEGSSRAGAGMGLARGVGIGGGGKLGLGFGMRLGGIWEGRFLCCWMFWG